MGSLSTNITRPPLGGARPAALAADGTGAPDCRGSAPGLFTAWAAHTSPAARLVRLHGYRPFGRNLGLCSSAPGPGSHGRTVCTPPARRAPQPGGLYQILVKTTSPPAGGAAGGPGTLSAFCDLGLPVDGRSPRGSPIFGLRLSSRVLLHQHDYGTTRPSQLSSRRVSVSWAFRRHKM